MVYKSIILIVISALCVSESLRPRGVPPDMAHFYDPNSSFHCLDGSGEIPFEHVNDDYCDCKARKLYLLCILCDEAPKFVWCGLEGFYPQNTARIVNPRCFPEFTE